MPILHRILLSLSVFILLLHSSLPHSHAACSGVGEEQPCLIGSPEIGYLQSILQFNPAPNHLEDFYPSSDCDILPTALPICLPLPPDFLSFSYANAATAALPNNIFLLQLFSQPASNEGFLPSPRAFFARTALCRAP